ADVGQELVAQALTLGGAGDQAGNVDELHGGGQHALGLDDLRQGIQARIRHRHDAAVGLDGAEREVLRGDAGLGQGVEQGGLADVRQANDAAIESHGVSLAEMKLKRGGQAFLLCSVCMALVQSPESISGATSRACSMLLSSSSCSLRGARLST